LWWWWLLLLLLLLLSLAAATTLVRPLGPQCGLAASNQKSVAAALRVFDGAAIETRTAGEFEDCTMWTELGGGGVSSIW